MRRIVGSWVCACKSPYGAGAIVKHDGGVMRATWWPAAKSTLAHDYHVVHARAVSVVVDEAIG